MSMYVDDYSFERFDGTEISKADIREDIINYYLDAQLKGNTKISDFNEGSEAYHLADLTAELMMTIYSHVNINLSNILIHEATGEVLDNYGDMRGVYRYGGSPSRLSITLKRKDEIKEAFPVYDSTLLVSEDAVEFLLDLEYESIMFPASKNELEVEAICTSDGNIGNITPDIKLMISDNDLFGRAEVESFSLLEEGIDDEEDDDYRFRILHNPSNYPIGSVDWYRNTVLNDEGLLENLSDCLIQFEEAQGSTNQLLMVYFKPRTYAKEGLVTENDDASIKDIPEKYLETNRYGEKTSGPRTVFKGRRDIIYLLEQDSYKIVNHDYRFKCSEYENIQGFENDKWEIRVLLEDEYELTETIIDNIRRKGQRYINNLTIGGEFVPYNFNEEVNNITGVLDITIYDKQNKTQVFDSIQPKNLNSCIYQDLSDVDIVEGSKVQ